MLALLSLTKVVSFLFALVWSCSHGLQRDDFPKKGAQFLLFAIFLLSLGAMHELTEVLRSDSNSELLTFLFVAETLGALLLAFGVAAWLPRVSSWRVKRELLHELSALQSQITSEERGRLEFMRSFSFDIRSVLQSLYKLEKNDTSRYTPEDLQRHLGRGVSLVAGVVNEYLVAQELDCTLTSFNKSQFALREELEALSGSQALIAIRESKDGGPESVTPLTIRVDDSVPDHYFTDSEKLKHILGTLSGFLRCSTIGLSEVVLEVQVSRLDEEEARLLFKLQAVDGAFTDRATSLLERCLNLKMGDYSSEMRMHGISVANASKMLHIFGGELELLTDATGFSFGIQLPLYKGLAWSQISESRARDTKNRFPGLRALVVDDNVIHGEIAKKVLEDFGCIVHSASGGREALAALCSKEIDIIFMDCDMPEIDGFETTQFIRKTEQKRGNPKPIIALTAHAMKDARRRCTEAGMDSFVAKPADSQEICLAIEEQIEKYSLCISRPDDETLIGNSVAEPSLDYYLLLN